MLLISDIHLPFLYLSLSFYLFVNMSLCQSISLTLSLSLSPSLSLSHSLCLSLSVSSFISFSLSLSLFNYICLNSNFPLKKQKNNTKGLENNQLIMPNILQDLFCCNLIWKTKNHNLNCTDFIKYVFCGKYVKI